MPLAFNNCDKIPANNPKYYMAKIYSNTNNYTIMQRSYQAFANRVINLRFPQNGGNFLTS